MSTFRPLVSILINNYNYGRFLRDAIDSALNQTYRNTEVIVVDDGSTDGSREIIASYGNRIVPVLKENGGQASAFNAGFAASRGELICYLDSDDTWFSTKVAMVVEEARSSPGAALIYHRLQPVSADLQPIGSVVPAGVFRGDISARVKSSGGWWATAATSALCFNRSIIHRIGKVPEGDFRIGADAYLCWIAPFLGRVLGMTNCLGLYRQHGTNNFSGTFPGMTGVSAAEKLGWRRLFVEKALESINSKLEELQTGVTLDLRRHWGYRLYNHYLRIGRDTSTLLLSWEALRLPGEPSPTVRLRTAGGLLLHSCRLQRPLGQRDNAIQPVVSHASHDTWRGD